MIKMHWAEQYNIIICRITDTYIIIQSCGNFFDSWNVFLNMLGHLLLPNFYIMYMLNDQFLPRQTGNTQQ